MLDLESVRLFVLTADLGNLTRAAEAAGTVQPVVSQRLKSLEAQLGRRLLDRSPRFVRPTADGAAFLERARKLLAAHDETMRFEGGPALRFTIGASDHALGARLAPLLQHVRASLPASAQIGVHLGLSQTIRARFEAGEFDVAVTRREGVGAITRREGVGAVTRRESVAQDGEVLGVDPLGWRAADGFALPGGASVPLAQLCAPCAVRAMAVRALDRAAMPWREAFTGGSCAAVLASVQAGLGVAAMGRASSGGLPDSGPALGLPSLPGSEIVMSARAGSPEVAAAIRALEASIRVGLSPA